MKRFGVEELYNPRERGRAGETKQTSVPGRSSNWMKAQLFAAPTVDPDLLSQSNVASLAFLVGSIFL